MFQQQKNVCLPQKLKMHSQNRHYIPYPTLVHHRMTWHAASKRSKKSKVCFLFLRHGLCLREAIEERLALLLEKDKKRLLLLMAFSQSVAGRVMRQQNINQSKSTPCAEISKKFFGREENKHPANSCHAGA